MPVVLIHLFDGIGHCSLHLIERVVRSIRNPIDKGSFFIVITYSVYDRLAVLLKQVEKKESVPSTGVKCLQKLFPTERRKANRSHLPRHRVVGKLVLIVCTHLKSSFLKKQNKQLIRWFYYIIKLILKIKKNLYILKKCRGLCCLFKVNFPLRKSSLSHTP